MWVAANGPSGGIALSNQSIGPLQSEIWGRVWDNLSKNQKMEVSGKAGSREVLTLRMQKTGGRGLLAVAD